jgi:hypothetical protein
MRGFLKHWVPQLRAHVEVLPYENVFRRRELPPGVHVFSDIERLRRSECRLAADLADRVVAAGSRVLNHPRDVLTRYALHATLYDAGINRFRSHRSLDPRRMRWPVFLRTEREHDGALTGLLHGPREFAAALLRLATNPLALRAGLLAVEFEDTRDAAGLYRKYSVLRIGEHFLPRHILVSRHWMLKVADVVDANTLRDEDAYFCDVPEMEQIREIFALARIEYGRIDYTRHEGRLVVWEINTNPGHTPRRAKLHPARIPSQERSVARVAQALVALDHGTQASTPIVAFGRADRARVWEARVAARLLG